MGDSVTPSNVTSGQVSAAGAPTSKLTFLNVPPALAQQRQISGEVVAVEGKQVTIKTAEGLVAFETDAALQVGQKILVKLQNAAIQLQTQSLAQIFVQNERGDVRAAPTNVQPPRQTAQAQPLPAVTLSPYTETTAPEAALAKIASLPVQVAVLPQKLSDTGQAVLLKQLLNLSPQQPLPPPLLEAIAKTQELLVTLKPEALQSFLSSAKGALPEPKLVEQILATLQGKLPMPEAGASSSVPPAQNPLAPQTPMPATLQTPQLLTALPPGVPLTAELVAQILQVLQQPTVQQQTNAKAPQPLLALLVAPQPTPVPSTPQGTMPAPMPQNFQEALLQVQQASPQVPANPLTQSTTPTTPMMALVTMPDGKQAFSVIHVPTETAKTSLPGTILVMAMPPKDMARIPALPIVAHLPEEAPMMVAPFHPSIGKDWQGFEALWDEVQRNVFPMPEMAGILRQTIPSPMPTQFTPAVLFFMAVAKGNFSLPWANDDALSTLPPEKAAMLSQLSRDMNAIRAALSDQGPADVWRPLPMPMQVGDQLVRLQWFFRHHTDEAPEHKGETQEQRRKRRKTRFLLDVPQTRMGNLQIDGLVQPKQLDVILRTEDTLQNHQRAAIGERFQAALDVSGFMGGISFQHGMQNYVRV